MHRFWGVCEGVTGASSTPWGARMEPKGAGKDIPVPWTPELQVLRPPDLAGTTIAALWVVHLHTTDDGELQLP